MQEVIDSIGTIGFIGLGDMGAGIAANYARKLNLLAFDLRPELRAEVEGWGGQWARDAADILHGSDVVCLCLVDDAQVQGFIERTQAFDIMRDGATLVLHSTLTPELVRELAEQGALSGVEVVDAPVSGARAASVAGTLSVMVGAPHETFERLRPMWDAIGTKVFRIGDRPGSGQVAKLCNNLMGLTNQLVALEALKLARAYGVSESVVVDVARAGSGNSWMIEHWGAIDELLRSHPLATAENGYLMLLKDLRTAVRLGSDAGVRLLIADIAAIEGVQLYTERAAGLGLRK